MRPTEEAAVRAVLNGLASSLTEFGLLPLPRGKEWRSERAAFDQAMRTIHYAGSCQRVGRCMRLLIVEHGRWLGGIVLGSTFPNIDCRDEALDLKRYVRGAQTRGLRSAWCAENREYWDRLQTIVNHARTFVFPSAQGRGVGVEAHRILPSEGLDYWKRWYPGEVSALDTLCDDGDSGLFRRNGWTHVGRTKGYGSDRTRGMVEAGDRLLRNNVALARNSRPWEVWIRAIGYANRPRSEPTALPR